MDTSNPRGVFGALPASWEGIGNGRGIGLIEGEKGKWATGTLTHGIKSNSGSCYLTSIFYLEKVESKAFTKLSRGSKTEERASLVDGPPRLGVSSRARVPLGALGQRSPGRDN
ncbi:hypothetical protein EVAR_24731_1 [Eumeta japonica]|uniref:Uncharacterized protein n=1 Tax=Eumeta variegata TaxID=151549 RepID=A0A4C1VC58_EUMVA|nr:hypothetical protein EVAR_24731_1 [Eumeta japonica]